jgi:glutathione synthase
MDPVETVIPARDSSLAVLTAAEARGHEVHHCLATDVSYVDGALQALTSRAASDPKSDHGMSLGPQKLRPLRWFDVAFIRTDPPFDHDYLTLTLLLEHARDELVIVNDPRGLREANEHLYSLRFPGLCPSTIVSANRRSITEFISACDGAVLKPVDGHAGRGVVRLLPTDPNINSIVDTMTSRGRRAIVVQQYLPKVHHGDKRILLLDGRPLGAILRVPTPDDFRATIARGDVLAADLTAEDRRIVETIAPALRRDGLWFVGIDVIDGYLTEVNVTSPTGLCQLAELTGSDPSTTVVATLEALVADRSRDPNGTGSAAAGDAAALH